ncbi:MAG: DegT/DnrJ/EryC1/StrS family aminotransferase, partial [Planctomycetota bacterium]
MQVPICDIAAQYAPLREEILQAVTEALEVQPVCNGPAVRKLEAQIAEYSTCVAAVGVSSGSDALLCSLMALGIGPGDEVITTPFTFFATVGAIARVGARAVFVDIEPDTFNIDPEKIPSALTKKTKAILPVHLYGQMAEMDRIAQIAEQHELYIIEDAAQSIGASHKSRKAGSLGTVGCFSFYPTKNLGAPGDAGMIVTQDTHLADKIMKFRNHGQSGPYYHDWVGGNFRMDSVQAAVLLVKLRHLDEWS